MEFPIESWFALPNRLTAEKKGTKQKKNNAPDLKSGAFCIYGLGVAMDDLLKKYTYDKTLLLEFSNQQDNSAAIGAALYAADHVLNNIVI